MQGHRVLWVPGCDHAGIATQVSSSLPPLSWWFSIERIGSYLPFEPCLHETCKLKGLSLTVSVQTQIRSLSNTSPVYLMGDKIHSPHLFDIFWMCPVAFSVSDCWSFIWASECDFAENDDSCWTAFSFSHLCVCQTVVERRLLRAHGKHRQDLTRQEFLQEVWKWKNEWVITFRSSLPIYYFGLHTVCFIECFSPCVSKERRGNLPPAEEARCFSGLA